MNQSNSSVPSETGLRVSQCFYTTSEFSKSVNLAVVEPDRGQTTQRSARDFWKEKFGPYSGVGHGQTEKDKSLGRKEKEEESAGPKKIDGIGEEAFWVSNGSSGVLYVLKGDAFVSIGIGGTDDEETKLKKSQALAEKALQRL